MNCGKSLKWLTVVHLFGLTAPVIIFSVAILCLGVEERFPNIDEVAHLPAGLSHWTYERFDLYRVNPPLVRMVAAFPNWATNTDDYNWLLYSDLVGGRPEFLIGPQRLHEVKLHLQQDYVLPRYCCLSFTVVGIACLGVWISVGVGRFSASIVCFFWCFSPNLLAHSQTIVPDVGAVAMGTVACFAFWRYLHNSNVESAGFAGVLLGLALLTKMTWITAIIALPTTALIAIVLLGNRVPRRGWKKRICDFIVVWTVAILMLNAGYLFEDTCTQLKDFEFCSQAFGGLGCNRSNHGNRFKDSLLGLVPVPFPKNYVLGIDYLKYEVETKLWSFLMGEWRFGSWPHYYSMTTLFKTPEPTLLAALIGVGVLVAGIRRGMVKPEVISMFLFLIIPASVCFASVSLQGGFNHHHRYVLMIYPGMFALAAYIASPVGVKLLQLRLPFHGSKKHSFAIPLALSLAGLSAASSLRVHPYYTSYFNTLSGGPENGWRLLGFSNIDWGQDILEVDRWLKEHPERRPLVMDLDYFGMNGELFDVPATLPPQYPKDTPIDEVRRSITNSQWWIISVKRLYNYPGQDGLEYLQQLEPVDRIAYAYHVYQLDPLPADSQLHEPYE